MFKKIRILILLLILLAVMVNTNLTRTDARDWREPLIISIYPINGDGSEVTRRYISTMDAADFRSIEQFMSRELQRYEVPQEQPFKIFLQPEISDAPPRVVDNNNTFDVIWWSLAMRYWSYQIGKFDTADPDIQMFVFLYDPNKHPRLDHSVGLEKGLIGVVNAYADQAMNESNNFIITHEILHTLGATDKYDFSTGLPLYPDGYADADQQPLYPQRQTEIMGGKRVISPIKAEMPNSLRETIIGFQTAYEIGLFHYQAE